MTSETSAVLVTAPFEHARRDRLHAVTQDRLRIQLLEPGQPLPATALADVEAAFLSTDLVKSNDKQRPNESLAAFGAAVAAAPRLRWIHTCSSGTDRAVLQEAMLRGVTVTSSTGANASAVAHSALAGMLALARGVPQWVRDQDAKRWTEPMRENLPRDLDGQHAVVVGLGAIGTQVARLCRSFGMHVTGIRRAHRSSEACDAVATFAELPSVLPGADWLLLCCPLTPLTRGLVDEKLLALLPAHACVVNVARGEVIVEESLFAALREGRLGGVYADVFVFEPLAADSAWWTLPRSLISPHAAWLSSGFVRRTQEMFLENLERWLAGRELLNVARPQQLAEGH